MNHKHHPHTTNSNNNISNNNNATNNSKHQNKVTTGIVFEDSKKLTKSVKEQKTKKIRSRKGEKKSALGKGSVKRMSIKSLRDFVNSSKTSTRQSFKSTTTALESSPSLNSEKNSKTNIHSSTTSNLSSSTDVNITQDQPLTLKLKIISKVNSIFLYLINLIVLPKWIETIEWKKGFDLFLNDFTTLFQMLKFFPNENEVDVFNEEISSPPKILNPSKKEDQNHTDVTREKSTETKSLCQEVKTDVKENSSDKSLEDKPTMTKSLTAGNSKTPKDKSLMPKDHSLEKSNRKSLKEKTKTKTKTKSNQISSKSIDNNNKKDNKKVSQTLGSNAKNEIKSEIESSSAGMEKSIRDSGINITKNKLSSSSIDSGIYIPASKSTSLEKINKSKSSNIQLEKEDDGNSIHGKNESVSKKDEKKLISNKSFDTTLDENELSKDSKSLPIVEIHDMQHITNNKNVKVHSHANDLQKGINNEGKKVHSHANDLQKGINNKDEKVHSHDDVIQKGINDIKSNLKHNDDKGKNVSKSIIVLDDDQPSITLDKNKLNSNTLSTKTTNTEVITTLPTVIPVSPVNANTLTSPTIKPVTISPVQEKNNQPTSSDSNIKKDSILINHLNEKIEDQKKEKSFRILKVNNWIFIFSLYININRINYNKL